MPSLCSGICSLERADTNTAFYIFELLFDFFQPNQFVQLCEDLALGRFAFPSIVGTHYFCALVSIIDHSQYYIAVILLFRGGAWAEVRNATVQVAVSDFGKSSMTESNLNDLSTQVECLKQ